MVLMKKTPGKNAHDNLNERAYAFVTEQLARGEIKPGQKLSEPSLAAACGVSRTPMREAVRRLVEEGVLYQVVKSGTYVTGFGAKDARDAYEIRSAIESALLERSVANLTKNDLDRLEQCCCKMHRAILAMRKAKMSVMTGRPEADFLAEDLAFHQLLLRASGNSLAEKIITNTYRRNQFFGTHSHKRTLRHVANAWRYHCEILNACRRGDTSGAVLWLKRHIASSQRDVLLPISKL
jgi:DNA-binding GntR family transcriptional regulator